MQRELANAPAHRRCVHETVPREACRDPEILHSTNPGPKYRVLIEAVHVVVPRPASPNLYCLEGWNSVRDVWPHDFVEPRVVDVPVESGRLVGICDPAEPVAPTNSIVLMQPVACSGDADRPIPETPQYGLLLAIEPPVVWADLC